MGRWGWSCGVSRLYLQALPSTGSTCARSCPFADPNLPRWEGSVLSCLCIKSLDTARRQQPSVAATQGSTKEGQDLGRGRHLLQLPVSATYSLQQTFHCVSKLIPQGSIWSPGSPAALSRSLDRVLIGWENWAYYLGKMKWFLSWTHGEVKASRRF